MSPQPSPAVPGNELAGVSVLCSGPWRNASSLRFLLPLRLPEGSYAGRCAAAAGAALPTRKQPLWRPFSLPVDDLMLHVRRYLNTDGGDGSTATLLTADTNELAWLVGAAAGAWSLELPRGRRVGFRVTAAHLLLFRLDLAFLVLDVAPDSEGAADWFDLLHYGRFFTGERARPVHIPQAGTAAARAAAALLRAANGDEGQPSLTGTGPLLEVLLATVLLSGETAAAAQQVNTPGQLLAYPVLFLTSSAHADAAVLARVIGSHHSSRRLTEELSFDLADAAVAYENRSWLFASTEGAGFVGVVDGPGTNFTRTTLPAHLRREYFLTYVVAAFQRYALLRLSEEVAEGALERRRQFAATQRRVLDFTGRGMFVQITHSAHHHGWYRHVQQTQQVVALHQEVRDEVQAFHDYERARESERHERRSRTMGIFVAVVTGVIVPLQLVTALFAAQVGEWPLLRSLPVEAQAYGTLTLVALLALLTYVLLRTAGRERDD